MIPEYVDPTLVFGAFITGLIALEKAGVWNRRRIDKKNGATAVTNAQLKATVDPLIRAVEKTGEKVDKHGERLAVLEAHVKPSNGRGGL